MVSKNIEKLYNIFLAVSRSSQNKPFKLRKDFSTFYETEQFVLIKKIERFLLQHPEIKPEIFFKAPYTIHPEQTFDLNFFASLRGIKAYTTYMKSLDNLPPDHEHQLKNAATSLQFIKQFCVLQKIKDIKLYVEFSSNKLYPDWFLHIKNRQISKYVMFGFSNTKMIMDSVKQQDVIQLLIPDLKQNFYSDLSKYSNSVKMKVFVTKGLSLLQKQINIS